MRRQVFKILRQIVALPVLYFGAALIAVLWGTVFLQLETEHESAVKDAEQDTVNIARIFEENVRRSISEIDQTIKYLRQSYEQNHNANWSDRINDGYAKSDQTLQLAIINESGIVIASTLHDAGQPTGAVPLVDLSDREHFRVHVDARTDSLFISKPVVGRISGKQSIQITRRFLKPDGSFGGVIVASFDPSRFSNLYSRINLGTGTGLALIGTDGIIRAGAGIFASKVGNRLPSRATLDALKNSPEGVSTAETKHWPLRALAYKAVAEYPLAVVVASEVTPVEVNRYVFGAGCLTILVIFAVIRVAEGNIAYNQATVALGVSEARATQKSNELELALSNMSQSILMVDGNGVVAFYNRRWLDLLEIPETLLKPGLTYQEINDFLIEAGEFRAGQASADSALVQYLRSSVGDPEPRKYERTRPNGVIIEVYTQPLPDGGFVRTLTDITDRRRSEEKIHHLSRHDRLTGLANRDFFDEKLGEVLAKREPGTAIALHLLDIDRFKPVNDALGHENGDELLRRVAERLRANSRQSDVLACLGGDEFAILEVEDVSREGTDQSARRRSKLLAEPYEIGGQTIEITVSSGIAIAPQDGETPSSLLQAASLARHAAKSQGRGTHRFHNDEMEAFARSRRTMENGLRKALAEQQLEMHYQPIHCVDSRRLRGYEALIRWRDPIRGLISPGDFIPIAEEAGLILSIGGWALQRACADLAACPGETRVAVNLSPLQFASADLLPTIKTALRISGLPAQRLEVEITESTLMQRDKDVLSRLHELHDLGIEISMDDFGTGYSSLSYLQTYPITRIKIDKSFVAGLGREKSAASIVAAIIALAKSLGMQTIAEGVETAEQLRELAALGCVEAQGYYFSPPKPAAEILFPPESCVIQ